MTEPIDWDRPPPARRPGSMPLQEDIPAGAVAGFGFGLTGFILSSIAGLVVFGDLVATGVEQDLVDSAAPTIIGLAIPGLIGIAAAGLSLLNLHPTQRLGRSLGMWGLIFALLSWINLVGYAISLRQAERDLESRLRSAGIPEEVFQDQDFVVPEEEMAGSDESPPTSVNHFQQRLRTISDPAPGLWVADGEACYIDPIVDGITQGEQVTNALDVGPEIDELVYDSACTWELLADEH